MVDISFTSVLQDTEVLENLQICWINVPVENVIRVKDAFGRIVYTGFCHRQQQIQVFKNRT